MIQKIVLRDQISIWLQEQMLSGKIKNGQKLSLVEISNDVNVSVTPIREALSQLARAGIVESISNRGFFVPKLSAKEAKDIYPAIYSLEKLAIEQSQFSEQQLKKLRQAEKKFEKASSRQDAVRYDLKFHEILIEGYENEVVKNILSDLKIRVFFYELEYMQSENFKKSIDGHKKLIEALEDGKIKKASLLLQENWEISAEFIKKYYSEEAGQSRDKWK
ncbi:MAG: GntR family transcriptional regulator [Bacteroidota bacterium]